MVDTIKILDPVKGLVDYVNDIKPYHTKVIESLVEYVGIDVAAVRVLEDYNINIELIFDYDTSNLGCPTGGFSTLPFGDASNTLVLSPDPAETVASFPALQSNNFIVLGDQRQIFDALDALTLNLSSTLEERIIAVTKSTGSPPSGGSFSFIGPPQPYYVIGTVFTIKGSFFNDTSYIINTPPVYDNVNDITTITVGDQVVLSDDVSGFISTIDPVNSGNFSVSGTVFTGGNIPLSPYTTVFINGLILTPPINININQRYISQITTTGLRYTKILAYSNALKFYNQGSPTVTGHHPDEGVVFAPIVALTQTPAATFTVDGDFTGSNIFIGDVFDVIDSTDNNVSYIITSITYVPEDFSGSPITQHKTIFGVASIHNSTPDGFIKLDIPSNVFLVDGDYTDFFKQGTRLTAITGSVSGSYNVLYSKFINNETRIRVLEDLITGRGPLIVNTSTSPNAFIVDGDQTATYRTGILFNVDNSLRNDGVYTITSPSIFDEITHTTTIAVAEPVDTSDATGEIHEFAAGELKYQTTGFGQTPSLCDIIPETLVVVNIKDTLRIDNIGIWARDDIIAHGINKDDWGYELPATTIFAGGTGSPFGPVVVFIEPPTPLEDDLWFDVTLNTGSPTAPGTLKVYQPVAGSPQVLDWIPVPHNKAYWIDTNTNYMYYRTVYQYYDNGYPQPTSPETDTGWILEYTKIPGYNDQIPAKSSRELQGFQTFFAIESANGSAETVFNFIGSPLLEIPLELIGSPAVPNSTLLEVTVNSTTAAVDILSPSSFNITAPRLRVGDFIEARVFDETGTPSSVFVGSFDTKTSIEETFDMLLGYKFHIDGTDSITNTIHIPESPTGDVFNIFMQGSPPVLVDNVIDIISSQGSPNNNGGYTITTVTSEGSPPTHVVLTVVEPLLDSGVFSGSPAISSGKALYQQWFQFIIVNTMINSIVVIGDATNIIANNQLIRISHSTGIPRTIASANFLDPGGVLNPSIPDDIIINGDVSAQFPIGTIFTIKDSSAPVYGGYNNTYSVHDNGTVVSGSPVTTTIPLAYYAEPETIKRLFPLPLGSPTLPSLSNFGVAASSINDNVYTVNGAPTYDGRNTTIMINETIIDTGNPGGWVESI